MIHGKKVIVVLPAYNADATLKQTYDEIPFDVVDDVLPVDDAGTDDTANIERRMSIRTVQHEKNRGYGGNQKTCYSEALKTDADIVVILHPDYQYAPPLVGLMAAMMACGLYDIVLGSRILGGGALKGGLPLYKYISNRVLTAFENLMLGAKLSEYHTGYRAYSRRVLEQIPFDRLSEDFVFDNQFLALAVHRGFRIGEVSCPTLYHPEASSINFRRSVVYGLGVVETALLYRLDKWGLYHSPLFD